MSDLHKGIAVPDMGMVSLRHVRRMKNLVGACEELNPRRRGIDGFPLVAFPDPLGYLRWDPNLLDQFPDLSPFRSLQEDLVYGRNPSATEAIRTRKRTLENGTVEDGIADRGILRRLTLWLDKYFSENSYAFRLGRCPEDAILAIRSQVRKGFYYATRTDFKDFFGSIDLQILETQLRDTIAGAALCDAILDSVSSVVVTEGRSLERRHGLPQGSILGPFLSNLYLHQFDNTCSHLAYFRFADDVLILSRTEEEALNSRKLLARLAERLRLRLNWEKIFVHDLRSESVIFLGYELRGGNVYPPEKAIQKLEKKLKEFRGQHDRCQAEVRSFVQRFHIGPVRQLFRRLGRRFFPVLPPHVSLITVLGEVRHKGRRGTREGTATQLRPPSGQGCHSPAEEANLGRPPQPRQPGADVQIEHSPLAFRDATKEGYMFNALRDREYLNFLRRRPCSFCGFPITDPHHAIRSLRGLSEAGMGQKGPDYLAIPVCRRNHRELHDGKLTISREEILEICEINLICYILQLKAKSFVQKIDVSSRGMAPRPQSTQANVSSSESLREATNLPPKAKPGQCAICTNPLRGRHTRFCSGECKRKFNRMAQRKEIDHTCSCGVCGREFRLGRRRID